MHRWKALILFSIGVALFGQFYWFVHTIAKRHNVVGMLFGCAIILLYIVTAYYVFV